MDQESYRKELIRKEPIHEQNHFMKPRQEVFDHEKDYRSSINRYNAFDSSDFIG